MEFRTQKNPPALIPLQLEIIRRHQRSQIAVWHTINRLVHIAVCRMRIAITKERILARCLKELAPVARVM